MIFESNYTWPAWVVQAAKSATSFATGYVFIMKDIPHAQWFSWDAIFMGMIAAGLYHGGLADSLPKKADTTTKP